MKKLLVLAGIGICATAWAQAPSASTQRSDSTYNPNQTICRNIQDTGSRLSRTRLCLTRAQWEERRRINREVIDKAQTSGLDPTG